MSSVMFGKPWTCCSKAAWVLALSALTQTVCASPVPIEAPSEAVIRQVVGSSKVDLQDLRVEPDYLNKPASSVCSLWMLQPKRISGAALVRFALTAEGKLLASAGDMDGLTRVLRECVNEDAVTWSQLIATYADSSAYKVLLEDDSFDLKQLQAQGVQDAAVPVMRPQAAGRELHFFMLQTGGRTCRVRAWVPLRGPVAVARTQVAP